MTEESVPSARHRVLSDEDFTPDEIQSLFGPSAGSVVRFLNKVATLSEEEKEELRNLKAGQGSSAAASGNGSPLEDMFKYLTSSSLTGAAGNGGGLASLLSSAQNDPFRKAEASALDLAKKSGRLVSVRASSTLSAVLFQGDAAANSDGAASLQALKGVRDIGAMRIIGAAAAGFALEDLIDDVDSDFSQDLFKTLTDPFLKVVKD